MKKTIPFFGLLFTLTLFISCSNDNDTTDYALMKQLEGKWKYTALYTDTSTEPIPVSNGYELELKGDRSFTSDEVNGYFGGHYTIINEPGKNIMLVYQRSVDSKLVYKHINYNPENSDTLYVYSSTSEPLSDYAIVFEAQILTRVE